MAEENTSPQNSGNGKGNARTNRRSANANAEGLSDYVFGKLQPQAIPLEEAVLGALMLDREALPVVMDILQPDSFYVEAHQHIYRAIIKLFERSNPVDMLTVTEELRQGGTLDKVGGAFYVVDLTNRVASAANIEYHARIIAQKHIQRELIRVSTRTIKDAYEDTTDVFNLLDEAEKGLFDITQNNLSRSYESMGSLSGQVLKQIEELSKKEGGLTGVPTGFTNLDRLTSGWQPSDLIIVAARPGMGKTSMVLAIALNASKDFGKPVAMFSLEMASTQLVQRLISMEAEIEGSKMRNGKLQDWEWQQLQTTVDKLSSVPIFIDDTPGINIFELRAKCRRLKMQHDIQLVIIDYLQLMTGGSENGKSTSNREQEIAGISRALKNMAKELSVPVIALSQLSRAVEVRGGSKRPQLSDLRESGSIEQDADMVAFIYRPEYYQILEDEQGQSLKGVAEFIVAKHRHGATDTIRLKFTGDFAKFGNLDDATFASLDDPLSGPFSPTTVIPSRMNDEDIPF
jgi:replicative DNA helicase